MKALALIAALTIVGTLPAYGRGVRASGPRFRPVILHSTSLKMPAPYRVIPIGSMRRENRLFNNYLHQRQHGAMPYTLPRIPLGSTSLPPLSSGPHLPR